MSIQTQDELDDFYADSDPWGYEDNAHDKTRKKILLEELFKLPEAKHTLDIGCGHGFITRDIPSKKTLGIDLSSKAITQAKKTTKSKNVDYKVLDLFDIHKLNEKYDLIIITGVLYPQYIGDSNSVVYELIDRILEDGGYLVSVHVSDWYKSRFSYPLLNKRVYKYREYDHILEVYKK